jgi:hypothetical protein
MLVSLFWLFMMAQTATTTPLPSTAPAPSNPSSSVGGTAQPQSGTTPYKIRIGST